MFIGSKQVENDHEFACVIAERIREDLRSMPHETWQHLAYKYQVYPGTRIYKMLSWSFV